MKSIPFTLVLVLAFISFSCDTEDARTPLGISISAPDINITIDENPSADTLLETLTATASDGSTIQYGNIVVEGSEDSKFDSETPIGALDIDNVTGELTIKDVSLFDYDLNTEINAIVNAISGNVKEAISINIFLNEILNFDSDLEALIDIYESNPDNTLDWDTTQTDITEVSNWTGVTFVDNRLTSLDLSGAGLVALPTSISKFSELTNLNSSNNNLTILPESIGGLEKLATLNLSANELTEVTESIVELENLTTLNLNTNLLTTLPVSITELENLVSLDISSNPTIAELPIIVCETFTSDTFTFIKDDTACDDEIPAETETP